MTRCKKCGKILKDPDSIARGYGPECWYQMTGEVVSKKGSQKRKKPMKGQMSLFDYAKFNIYQ